MNYFKEYDDSWPELISGSIITVLLIFIIHYYLNRRKFWKLVNKIPGPPSTLPIVGNALELNIEHHELADVFWKWTETCPKHFRLWLLDFPYLVLFRAVDVEPILSSSVHIEKSSDYKFLYPWLGTGLLTSSGDKWRARRKLLTPAFHFRILEDFVEVFNEQSEILVNKLMKDAHKDIDVLPPITMCTLDIICESVMGCHTNAQGDSDSLYVRALEKLKDTIHSRMITFYLWPTWLFNLTPSGWEHNKSLRVMHEFSDKVIRERKTEFKTREKPKDTQEEVIGKKRRLAFLDLLIEASDDGRELSDLDIREEVDTFMFEGHDTTAVAIAWTLFLLAQYPHVQKKLHEELDAVLGDDRSQPITSEHLKEMKYMECVIKEGLRFAPSVPMIGRKLTEDVIIDKYTVPAGVTALIITPMLHRDSALFPDPETYYPDRFLPENFENRHPYSYVPFSAGPRNCIGQRFAMMEEKIVLAWVLRAFTLDSNQPFEDVKVLMELIMRPKDGLFVNFTPR